MHNSFILQQYVRVCYTAILNMFRGGQIVSPKPLVSSSWKSVNVQRFPGWRYQKLWWYNLSSWGWAACSSKHVKDRSV